MDTFGSCIAREAAGHHSLAGGGTCCVAFALYASDFLCAAQNGETQASNLLAVYKDCSRKPREEIRIMGGLLKFLF